MSVAQLSVLVLICLQALLPAEATDITCKDPNGNSVDWFIVYKLPKISESPEPLIQDGLGHYYMDVNSQQWKLSEKSLNQSKHAIAYTLQQIYDNHRQSNVVYLMYNDEWPSGKKTDRGHTKGDLCLDKSSGFWMVHSVPQFPDFSNSTYFWPDNGLNNGQTFLCVTFNYEEFTSIARQLKYMWPSVYDSHIPSAFAKVLPELVEVVRGKHIMEPPWYRQENLKSLAGQRFISFAKTSQFDKDIYADWLAPYFQSSMRSETWQDGRGKMPSSCGEYKVENVQDIAFKQANFSETKDHSKWAVTTENKEWTCIGGINRQEGQKERDGGSVCFEIPAVCKQFTSIISKVEECK
ncbi:plancitoxin-1-like [Ptychodera flava]|uniref:plancitoxin-1-like n=1 Tax=Ptychodera flava TaxID=63121 RepID=UPI00396A4FF6